MGLTSTFYAALSGLDTSSTQFQVIGNNISNVNTSGYKAQSALFQTEFSQTLSIGSSPQGISGGTNPEQIGMGTQISTVRTDFSAGSLQTTGISSDLAIQGNGFFITKNSTGQDVYTRDGAFTINSQNKLVNSDGNYVQGYQVDNSFNIIPGQIGNISIPLGSLSVAEATKNATIDGILNSAGATATQGTVDLLNQTLKTLVGGVTATAATGLTQLQSSANPGVQLFHTNDVITVGGTSGSLEVGGKAVPAASFTVTGVSTLANLCTFLQQSLGIDTSAALPQPGSVAIVAGQIQITGNAGTDNAISSQGNALSNLAITLNGTTNPFTWTQTQAANGESVNTTFTAYDSLGDPLTMDMTFVKEAATNAGQTWRFYVKSPNDTTQQFEGDGTVTFGTNGKYISSTGTQINVNLANTGAATPQVITLGLSAMTADALQAPDASNTTGQSTKASQVAVTQDGEALGTLNKFGVDTDGTITGIFSNGMTKSLGQVALATFANNNGLLAQGQSSYTAGPNSGTPVIGAPETMSAGSIQGGALELSNVDLSTEFVNMITTSTAFSANGRTITTANQMMQELLQMGK